MLREKQTHNTEKKYVRTLRVDSYFFMIINSTSTSRNNYLGILT